MVRWNCSTRQALDRAEHDDAGIVDQHADRTPRRFGRGDHLVPRRLVGHVEVAIHHGVAEFVGQRSTEIVEHVRGNHPGARGHEPTDVRLAHAPGCARHDRYDTIE